MRNNPLRFTDPDGHCAVVCVAVISVLVGGTAIVLGVNELKDLYLERIPAEKEGFQTTLNCIMGNANCTEDEARSLHRERVKTFTEAGVLAIENIPGATPATNIIELGGDLLKQQMIDKMLEAARKEQEKKAEGRERQPRQQEDSEMLCESDDDGRVRCKK